MLHVGRQDERIRDICQRLVLATVFVAMAIVAIPNDHWLLLRW